MELKYNVIDYDNKYRPNVMETIHFINEFAKKLNIPYKEAQDKFDVLIDTITDALVNDDRVVLQDFGVFKVVWRKKKTGYNYRHQKYIDIPACYKPAFYPGKQLKETIKNISD